MRDIITPAITMLVGVASGIYIFQPIILEQLKKDGNLNPKYDTDEKIVGETFGNLTAQTPHTTDTSLKGDKSNNK